MAFVFDEAWINNGQLVVASDTVKPPGQGLGKGADRVRHSAYIEGPLQVGQTGDFTTQQGTVMIGKDGNTGSPVSLYVKGDGTNAVYIEGDLYVSGDTDTGNKGRLASRFATADSKPKPFDMEHPSKGEGYRLRYACIEGPLQVGQTGDFTSQQGTVMIGKDGNTGASKALYVKGDTEVEGNINAPNGMEILSNIIRGVSCASGRSASFLDF